MEINIELFDLYLADMQEHLELLNESLLKFEKNYKDKDIINTVFRSFHTMKGSTATMGFSSSAELIHKMEDILQEIRDGKIEVDNNVIKILFACHDFIEKAIKKISEARSEEGIEASKILNILDNFKVAQNSPKKAETTHAEIKQKISDQLYLSPSETDYVQRAAASRKKAYTVSMKVEEECQFVAIRIWMAYNTLEQVAEIIKAFPPKPKKEDFADSTFIIKSNSIKAIVLSFKSADEIYQLLDRTLSEIEQIKVNEFVLGQKSTSSIIDAIIDGDSSKVLSDNDIFSQMHMKEIRNHVCQLEMNYLELVTRKDAETLNSILHSFHVIKELANTIDHTLIYNITVEIERLLDDCYKREAELGGYEMGELFTAITLLKELCDDETLLTSQEYLSRVKEYLDTLAKNAGYSNFEEEMDNNAPQNNRPRLGEILVQQGVVDQESIDDMIQKQKEDYKNLKFGQVLLKEEKANLKDVVDALNIQSSAKPEMKSQSFIRIPEQKADSLVDMLGELLIIESLCKQQINNLLNEMNRSDSNLSNNIIRMERITKDIQSISMSLRMVSLKQSFQKLLRIGRDTASELDKDIDITVNGEDTEIDRSIVEKIQDPLMHLLRNAISHGIEEKDERINTGKQLKGQVVINAYNKRGFVFIEVTDDGKGLKVEKLYNSAKEKKLIDPNRNYTEDEILRFIYLPGFSTQESINSVSGRGVGMNVVETEILKIGGKIEILNRPGLGCTFILKIPINLATINGTVVDVFGDRYIIPTLNIKEMFKPEPSQWINIKGKTEMVKVRNEILQIIPVGKILGIKSRDYEYMEGMIVAIELDRKVKALPVKSIIGKQEIVVKPLGADFRGLDFAAGATILGDGKVSLILDIETMFKQENAANFEKN